MSEPGPAADDLLLLYRGPLASCNYDCPYCPFGKRRDTPEQLRCDRLALRRFVEWVEANPLGRRLSVLFTPWGEALIRPWYRKALVHLSTLPQVGRVVAQTNLSGAMNWLDEADPKRVALWATYHPGQVGRQRFLAACARLRALGIRHSVGMVALPEHWPEAVAMRGALPAETYLWLNAADGYGYDQREILRWSAVDPLFGLSPGAHVTRGRPCWTGHSAVSVSGDGTVRRCHFVSAPLGNLYDGSLSTAVGPQPCPRATCDCHIGYVHLKDLDLYRVFAGGVAERIPAGNAAQWVAEGAVFAGSLGRDQV